MGQELPKDGFNYTGTWYEGKKDEDGNEIPPANKNARYTVSLKAMENCDPELDNPMGVELAASCMVDETPKLTCLFSRASAGNTASSLMAPHLRLKQPLPPSAKKAFQKLT